MDTAECCPVCGEADLEVLSKVRFSLPPAVDGAEPLTHVNFFSEEALVRCMSLAGLGVLSVETRFQWSCSGKSWCINLLCRPGSPGSALLAKWKSTRRQRLSPLYYPRLVFKKAGLLLPGAGIRHP